MEEKIDLLPDMQFVEGGEKLRKLGLEKNSDGYGRQIYAYAERWAKLMQDAIKSDGKTIAEVADSLSISADLEGITGFMYGAAVSILSATWEYGEDLKKWHNEKYNYNGEGVVNPAIIALG